MEEEKKAEHGGIVMECVALDSQFLWYLYGILRWDFNIFSGTDERFQADERDWGEISGWFKERIWDFRLVTGIVVRFQADERDLVRFPDD